MANVNLSNLARMTVSSSGTGTITLNTAVPGFLTFDLSGLSTAAAGSVVRYAINDTTQSEIAYGTYTSSALSLTRGSSTTGMKSTNSNSPINMSASTQVFVTEAAADFPFIMDTSGTSATSSVALTLTAALTYGGVTLSNAVTGTGNMVLSASPTFTGTVTFAASTVINTSGDFVNSAAGNHHIAATNAAGVLIFLAGDAVTSRFSISSATATLSVPLTYGGVTLSNAVTGTGNMVLSASPTFTGTVTIATLALTTVGAHTISGAITYGGVALNNAVTGTGNMVLSASPTFTGTVTFAGGTTINGSGDYVNSLTGQHLIAATHASGSIVVFAGDAVTARLSISSTQFHITNVTEVVSFCAANFFSAANVNVTANATSGQPYFIFQIGGSSQSFLTDDGGNIIVSSNATQTAGMYIVHGASSWTAISDARLPYKRTARPLSVLNRLDSFRLYENEVNGRTELFVEAQEFHKVLPHLVKVGDDDESFVPEKSTDPRAWGVSYDRAGVAALMAVKELRDEVRAALRRP